MALRVDLKVGESIGIDGRGNTRITLEKKSGQLARLYIESDEAVTLKPPVLLKRPEMPKK